MSESNWNDTTQVRPSNGESVWAMDSGGNVSELVFDKNLWWFPDRSMYVYYVPRFWKPKVATS